jgi:hypothetical protein
MSAIQNTDVSMSDAIPAPPNNIFKTSTAEIPCRALECSTVPRAFKPSGRDLPNCLLRTALLSGYIRLYISAIGRPSRRIMLTPLDRRTPCTTHDSRTIDQDLGREGASSSGIIASRSRVRFHESDVAYWRLTSHKRFDNGNC